MQEQKQTGIAATGIPEGATPLQLQEVPQAHMIYATDTPGTYKVPTYRQLEDGTKEYAGHCDFHLYHENQGKQERFFYMNVIEALLRVHKETV